MPETQTSMQTLILPTDHPFVDVSAPNAFQEYVEHNRTLASHSLPAIERFLRDHPGLRRTARQFTLRLGLGEQLYCLSSWDFGFLHNWAIRLLKEKGHKVGNYHPSDGLINIDGRFVDFQTMYEFVGKNYPSEWQEYQKLHLNYLNSNQK